MKTKIKQWIAEEEEDTRKQKWKKKKIEKKKWFHSLFLANSQERCSFKWISSYFFFRLIRMGHQLDHRLMDIFFFFILIGLNCFKWREYLDIIRLCNTNWFYYTNGWDIHQTKREKTKWKRNEKTKRKKKKIIKSMSIEYWVFAVETTKDLCYGIKKLRELYAKLYTKSSSAHTAHCARSVSFEVLSRTYVQYRSFIPFHSIHCIKQIERRSSINQPFVLRSYFTFGYIHTNFPSSCFVNTRRIYIKTGPSYKYFSIFPWIEAFLHIHLLQIV